MPNWRRWGADDDLADDREAAPTSDVTVDEDVSVRIIQDPPAEPAPHERSTWNDDDHGDEPSTIDQGTSGPDPSSEDASVDDWAAPTRPTGAYTPAPDPEPAYEHVPARMDRDLVSLTEDPVTDSDASSEDAHEDESRPEPPLDGSDARPTTAAPRPAQDEVTSPAETIRATPPAPSAAAEPVQPPAASDVTEPTQPPADRDTGTAAAPAAAADTQEQDRPTPARTTTPSRAHGAVEASVSDGSPTAGTSAPDAPGAEVPRGTFAVGPNDAAASDDAGAPKADETATPAVPAPAEEARAAAPPSAPVAPVAPAAPASFAPPAFAATTPVPSGQDTPDPVAPSASEDAPTRHATVICIANQKGGVGKTTTTVSLAAALALEGAQVLVVDLDPQGNATTGLGLRGREGAPSTYRVLIEKMAVEDATEPTGVRGLHCVPSSLDLAGAEIELVSVFSREQRLRNAIDEVRDLYDVVIIDCPPSLGLLTINALVAADQVVVPIQCEYYALEGLGQLMRTLDLVRNNLNERLELGGVVLTMYDARTRLSQQVVDEVRTHFGDTVYETIIPRTVRLSEAPGFGQPINVFDPSSRGARAYQRLGQETAARLGLHLESEVTAEEGVSALDRLLGSVSAASAQEDQGTDAVSDTAEAEPAVETAEADEPLVASMPTEPSVSDSIPARPPASERGDGGPDELPPGHADRLRDAATAALASFRAPVTEEPSAPDGDEADEETPSVTPMPPVDLPGTDGLSAETPAWVRPADGHEHDEGAGTGSPSGVEGNVGDDAPARPWERGSDRS